MNEYRIFQAQILAKDPSIPRAYSVVEIPNGQKLVKVQLGNALKDQSAPLLGSIVLVLQMDAYNSYILMVLREPFDFLTTNNQYRGFIPSTGNASQDIAIGANPIQDGEIFMEATGPGAPGLGQSIPGFGAHLYLGNSGVAQIESGSMSEKLIIGGQGTADDHEVILSADNGFVESNPNEITQIKSTYNWDNLNNIEFGNVLTNPVNTLTIPIATMTIDALGNIELFNTTPPTGLKAASLVMDIAGGLSLSSGTSGVPAATISMDAAGIINMNSGTLGAARLTDTVVANPLSDPAFYAFWVQQEAIFTALPPATDIGTTIALANALKAALIALTAAYPQSLTSKITTSSSTVFIGN
jgi:hypothetical protein